MRAREYDVVRLRRAAPEHGLAAGAIGTVVVVFDDPPAYEIELCDAGGRTLAILTLREEDIELVPPST